MLLLGQGAGPDGFATIQLSTAGLGGAFVTLDLATLLRWMVLLGEGWPVWNAHHGGVSKGA